MKTAKFHTIDSSNRPVFKSGKGFYCIIDELISDQYYDRWSLKLDAIGTEKVHSMIERANSGTLNVYTKHGGAEGEPAYTAKEIRLSF